MTMLLISILHKNVGTTLQRELGLLSPKVFGEVYKTNGLSGNHCRRGCLTKLKLRDKKVYFPFSCYYKYTHRRLRAGIIYGLLQCKERVAFQLKIFHKKHRHFNVNFYSCKIIIVGPVLLFIPHVVMCLSKTLR